MLFRNLFLFRFTPPLAARDAVELQTMLEPHSLQPIGALELSRSGFVAPTAYDDALVHSAGRYALFAVGTQQRLLPSGVVEKELKIRCEESETRTGKKPGPRERRSLKDEVITALMPRAFVQESKLHAYIDFDDGWLVINTASRKLAELMVKYLRMALVSFKCTPMAPEQSPRGLMTDWVLRKAMPGISLDDSIELREPVEKGAVVRVTHQDLDTDEIREHVNCGKQVFKLALFFRDELAFVLDESLTVRRLRFLDNVIDELRDKEFESAELEVAAQFVLMTGEIGKLLHWMSNTFGIEAVPKMKLDGGDAAPEMRDVQPTPGFAEGREPGEKEIRVAAKMYDARDAARSLLGDTFAVTMLNYAERIKARAALTKQDLLPCVIEWAKKSDDHDKMLIFAAYVEMVEPSAKAVNPRVKKAAEKFVNTVRKGGASVTFTTPHDGKAVHISKDAAGAVDELFRKALDFVVLTKRVSISALQRQLQIGYNRAARIVESLEEHGHVSPPGHNGERTVLA